MKRVVLIGVVLAVALGWLLIAQSPPQPLDQPPARPCYAPPHYVPYKISAEQARYGFGVRGIPEDAGSWVWVSEGTKAKWDSGWLPKKPQLGPFPPPPEKGGCAKTITSTSSS